MIKEKVYKEKKIEKSVILPGDPFGLPDDFKVVVFIDNAYLIRLENYFLKINLVILLKILLNFWPKKNNFFVSKIYLYDAPPFQSKQSNEREKKMKENYDKFILFLRCKDLL